MSSSQNHCERGFTPTQFLELLDLQRRSVQWLITAMRTRTELRTINIQALADDAIAWWTNWWSPKRKEGIGWLAGKKLGRKAHRLEYAQLSAFVHSSPALLDFYFGSVAILVEKAKGVII